MQLSFTVPAALLLAAAAAAAEVRLNTLFSDHVVLQREVPVPVWGKAAPGERVTVRLAGQTAAATADRIGRWTAWLRPMPAGGPYRLEAAGASTVVVEDVWVGEVWIASGQSNMEWPLADTENAAHEIATARHPQIRFFRFPHRVSEIPLDQVWGKWNVTTPETVADDSAVAYYFARELQQRLKVPIGIIQSAWGGTPAEAWTSGPALAAHPALSPLLEEWARALEQYPAAVTAFEPEMRAWQQRAAADKRVGRVPPEAPRGPRGPRHPHRPSGLWNGMVAPLVPYAMRGVIWYQGEANAGTAKRAALYKHLFPTLIADWRRAWGQVDFPFLFVQLANYRTIADADWPEVREAQRQSLSLRNTAMAVTVDIGNPDDIHPRNKKEVGRRLSLAARATVYGEKLVYSGPLFRQITREGSRLRLWFDHADGGLVAKGGRLAGFEVAGEDGRFNPAHAEIEGESVVVQAPGVERPAHARYAWKDTPEATLFNAHGLPASPFRTR